MANREKLVIIGKSPRFLEALSAARKAAESGVKTILLTGETGTGKEIFARFIHEKSARANGPFIPVDCSTIPESLLEAELFGFVKGAFTGAVKSRKGLVGLADKGTLLIDEISNMPLNVQNKLLRFLETRRYRPIGAAEEREVDVRVIAATNIKLETLVRKGKFRKDLYYRLSLINIYIPPLREREDDVILLAQFFLKKFIKEYNIKEKRFTPDALEKLRHHSWPGNVRELRNIVESAALMSHGTLITSSDIHIKPTFIRDTITSRQTSEERDKIVLQFDVKEFNMENIERAVIIEALKFTNWNKKRAADMLGISRMNLLRKIKKYGIE